MNKIITILLISILAMSITANAEVLNLTQKDTTTWLEVSGGATATLTYAPEGDTFVYTLDFYQDAEVPIDYSLIYYKDQACNPTSLPGIVTVIGSGTSTFSGSPDIGSLPAVDDANSNSTGLCNYAYPYGAKIWLVPSTDIDGANLTWSQFSNYLFEENIRDDTNAELSGTSHLITYTKTIATPTPSPTQPITSSSGGSSSGYGGSGVNSNEPLSNVAESDRKVLDWRAGYQTKYAFKYNVYEVIINAKNNEDDVMMKYEGLKSLSSNVISSPLGTVYQYFNLYSGSKRFESAVIRFKSDKTPSLLYRWTNGKWEALPTTPIGIEGNNILYEVEVLTFSNFAIASAEMPTSTETVQPITIIAEVQPTATVLIPAETTPAPTPTVPGFEIAVLLISGIVAIGLFKFRKN